MLAPLQHSLIRFLRWSERYTKTDMVYLTSGGFWLVVEQIAGVAFSLALAIAFGHFASKDMFGNYKYILSLAGLLSAVSLSGLGDAMSQSVTKGFDGALLQSWRLQLRWSAPFILVTVGTSIYYGLQGNDYVAGALLVVAILQPILSSVSVFPGFFYAQRDFARGALYSVLMNGFTFAALLVALLFGERAIILVGTYFVARTLVAIYGFWKASKAMRNTTEDPHLLHFSTHLSVMNVIAAIADKFDNVIVFSLLGPAQLAVYSFAIGAPEQIKGVMKNLYGLALPKFAGRSLAETQVSIWGKLGLLTVVLALGMGVYALIAPYLFHLLFPIYLESIPYSQWYALSIVFSGVPPIVTAALTAHKKTQALYITTNTAPFVLIGALIALVPAYGIAGAIASQIIYRAVNAGVCTWQFMRARD